MKGVSYSSRARIVHHSEMSRCAARTLRDSTDRQIPIGPRRSGAKVMKVATYEATVENGQMRLSEPVPLPERAKVYVVVPGAEEAPRFHIASPRLTGPER